MNVIRPVIGKGGNSSHLAVTWDARRGAAVRANVVAPAFDLRSLTEDEGE